MFKKFTLTDILLFISAFMSLIFSEILYFRGEEMAAIFIGLWVPSILTFGIYLKLINKQTNGWVNTIFRWSYNFIVWSRFFVGIERNEKIEALVLGWFISFSMNSRPFYFFWNSKFQLLWHKSTFDIDYKSYLSQGLEPNSS